MSVPHPASVNQEIGGICVEQLIKEAQNNELHSFNKTRLIRYNNETKTYIDYGNIAQLKPFAEQPPPNTEAYHYLEIYRNDNNKWIGALIFDAPSKEHAENQIGINAIIAKINQINRTAHIFFKNKKYGLAFFLQTAIQFGHGPQQEIMIAEKIGTRKYIINALLLSLLPQHVDQIIDNNYIFYSQHQQHILLIGSKNEQVFQQDMKNLIISLTRNPEPLYHQFFI